MNSFEQNDQIQSELVQTIKNLQLIAENNYPYSAIEKDLLLQCLRKLYLLTLKYVPQDTCVCGEQTSTKIAELVEKTSEKEPQIVPSVVSAPEPVSEKPIEVEEPLFEPLLEEEIEASEEVTAQPENEVNETPQIISEENEETTVGEMFDDAEEAIDFLVAKTEEKVSPVVEEPKPVVEAVKPVEKVVEPVAKNTGLLFAEEELQKVEQPTPKRSLNDLLNEQKKDNSLADKLRQSKVDDLSKAISLNDKFLFIKELFQNKGGDFSNAIQTLNKCVTMEEANEELKLLKKYYSWDTNTAAYTSFYDLVSRKFQ